MEELMRNMFEKVYAIDYSLNPGENQVDIFAFLRERFPGVRREIVCAVAEELAAQGSYVERERIWAYAHGGY